MSGVFGRGPSIVESNITPELAVAFAAAQAELGKASKDRKNPAFHSKYADLEGIIEISRPVLNAHGLTILQLNEPDDKGVTLRTMLLHASGGFIVDNGMHVPASKDNAHGFGSALTYARRYAWASMIGLATEEDDDGNAASKPAPRKAAAKPKAKAPERPLVSEDQRLELVAAALAAGIDKSVAERKAKNTRADEFKDKLAALKEKATKGSTNA